MNFILDLQQCSNDVFDLVGGKCASLGALIRAGARVPPGFVVTTAAWRQMVVNNGLQSRIDEQLRRLDSSASPHLAEIAAQVRTLIEQAPIPLAVETALREAWTDLTARSGAGPLGVAVRSSATAEDLPGASFAGLHETMLGVRDPDALVRHVRKCWASLHTPRAIAYRLDNGFAHDQVFMAVGVQKMVQAKAAGVAFSLNPSNGDRSKIAIDSSFGLGEAVVSGRVTPDHFLVDKVIFEVVRRVISTKEVEHLFDSGAGEVVERAIDGARWNQSSLSAAEIVVVAKMAKWAEQAFGCPQDIEWAIDAYAPAHEAAVFLQSRPETVWSRKSTPPVTTASSRGMAGMVSTLIHGVKIGSRT